MAWEISISDEGWQDILNELETWNRQRLIDAICDNEYQRVERIANDNNLGDFGVDLPAIAANHMRFALVDVLHETLVEQAYDLIVENNTCDNGGFAYWIDREGFHKVTLPDRQP